METNNGHEKMMEMGKFVMYRKITNTYAASWRRVGGHNLTEPFYGDVVVLPLKTETTGYTISEKRPGIYPVLETYHTVCEFSVEQGHDAVEYFRQCVNTGRAN